MEEVFVCNSGDMADGDRRLVRHGTAEVGVFRVGEALVAWHNRCAHQGGPICQGRVFPRVTERLGAGQEVLGFDYVEADRHIVCPWHGYEYDLKTGRNAGNPSLRLMPAQVVERDGGIYVRL